MLEAGWNTWVHECSTGNPIERFTSSSSSWSSSLSGDGESTETVVVNDAAEPWDPGAIAEMFQPNARMMVRWWGQPTADIPTGVPVYAHKIREWDYARDDGRVTVKAVDLIGEADWRMVDGVGAWKYSTLSIAGRTPSGAIAQALARMMQWGPEWQYPIDLPADAPGEISGEWPFWKKFRISDIIREIEDRGGVETFLRPYGTPSGGVRFQTRVGGPITIGGTKFNIDAVETPLGGIHYRVNGARQITGLLGVGNGSGEDQETAWQGGGPFVIPIRDIKETFPDLVGTALQQATDQFFARNVRTVGQWDVGSFTVGAENSPELALPGSVWNLESKGDPVIPDDVHPLRVIKVSGGNGYELKTEVQSAAA